MVSESEEDRVALPRSLRPLRIDHLLRSGLTEAETARRLGIKVSYVMERAKMVRLDAAGHSTDVTSPKFARHDEHVAAVRKGGGYTTMCLISGRGFRALRSGI